MECLLPYLSMVTVPHTMVGLERMLDYRGVGLERFHCTSCPGVLQHTKAGYNYYILYIYFHTKILLEIYNTSFNVPTIPSISCIFLLLHPV